MSGEHHLAVLQVVIEAFDELGNWFFGFVAHKWTGMRNEV
jgi:hypothetical protein